MDIKKELTEAIQKEDFDETYDLLQTIDKDKAGTTYIEFLISFIMENPDVDYGMPGPVVHFIEQHPVDKYIGFLLKALQDKPNGTLLWMLNRIINAASGLKKRKYIKILKQTMERNDVSEYTRKIAKEFYDFQTSGK